MLMNKEEMFKTIYPYFLAVVNAYYSSEGKITRLYLDAMTILANKAQELGLTAVSERNGGDTILIVEKPEEYVIVSADLDIYTYEDEEMEAE